LIEERCIGCGTCTTVCPTGAISVRHGKAHVDEGLCTHCEACVAACPQQALAVHVSLQTLAADQNRSHRQVDAQEHLPVARNGGNKPAPEQRMPPQPFPSRPQSPAQPQQSGARGLLPALGAILGLAVRELVPRVTPHLLDLILPPRAGPPGTGRRTRPGCAGRGGAAGRGGRHRQQCRRWRAGRW
jgi:NAD-dependent dihydropyrimidine dehydrogenase PreA subunit